MPKFVGNKLLNLIIMKKLVLLIGIIIFSLNVFGQRSSDRYVSPALSGSFGFSKYKYVQNNHVYQNDDETTFSLTPDVEFGFFANDRIRLGVELGIPFQAGWLGVLVAPNMGFYFPITDKFYYAPEIGVGFETGFYDFRFNSDYAYYQLSAYINLCAFEFQVKENVSIAMQVGEIGYSFFEFYRHIESTQQFYAYLNTGMMIVRFFF